MIAPEEARAMAIRANEKYWVENGGVGLTVSGIDALGRCIEPAVTMEQAAFRADDFLRGWREVAIGPENLAKRWLHYGR